MHLFLTFYIDLLVELCVKCLLQKAVHALCSLCWLHKWGGLKAQLLHIAPGNARGSDVALIKVSRSVRAVCIMRGNAPWGVKGINGLRAFGAWHFCAGAKMPNVSIAVYVPPGRCPGLWATFGLTARPNHLPGVCANWFVFNRRFLDIFGCARHSPNKFGSALACTKIGGGSA